MALISNLARRPLTLAERDITREEGMSLVELIIYILLVAIIGALITGLMLNTFRVSGEVKKTSESSNDAQVLMDRIELAVRNAGALKIVDSGNSTLLITQTRSTQSGGNNAQEYRCIGMYFNSATSKVHYVTDPVSLPRTKAALSNLSLAASWPVFLDDVYLVNGQKLVRQTGTGIETRFSFAPPRISNPVELRSTIDTRSLGENLGKCY